MGYRSDLEARLAKKTTRAIVEYEMLEDGDRVLVGLSGGKDSWALLQILDVLRQRVGRAACPPRCSSQTARAITPSSA